jgi:hypothetical protein
MAGSRCDVVDKSWGLSNAAPPTDQPRRAGLPAEGTTDRLAARARAREAAAQEREAARQARLDERARLAAEDPHAAGARQPRGSGRKDIVREQRDTTGYALIKDVARIRTLAERGASVDGLARVFGLPEDEIERILATAPTTD